MKIKQFFCSFLILLSASTVGLTAQDTDGDGISNVNDLDDDNDGITDCVERGFLGNDISDVFQLRGNSVIPASTTYVYEVQLTANAPSQAGQIWSKNKVNFNSSFVLKYKFNAGTNDALGADGFAAVFQNDPAGTSAIGSTGYGVGALGIKNGIALEVDTFDNGVLAGDTPNDHGSIWITDIPFGQTPTYLSPATSIGISGNVEDGAWHNVVTTWDKPTNTLSYTVDGVDAGSYSFNNPGGISTYLGGQTLAFYGYTASTGSFFNEQRVAFENPCDDLPLFVDTDADGIIDELDVDSDNDGCADAIEGSENINVIVGTQTWPLNLESTDPNYSNRGRIKVTYNGTSVNSQANIISRSSSSFGIPQLVNNAGNNFNTVTNPTNIAGVADNTDVIPTTDIGQGIGSSKNDAVSVCVCYAMFNP